MSEPVMPPLLGGTKDLRDKRGKVGEKNPIHLLLEGW